MMLTTFFPKHTRPRTVVHAGPLLLERNGGERSLRRFLRIPRKREVLLVHRGHDSLRALAQQTGVTDIAVDAPDPREAYAAAEMALALGARRLDFTIDTAGVAGSDGDTLREIDIREAETLARDPALRPRVRAKLRAGCEALRMGVNRVRIGHPAALARDRATVLRPDAATASAVGAGWTSRDGLGRRDPDDEGALAAQPPPAAKPAARGSRPPWRTLHPAPRRGPSPRERAGEEPGDALHDPWWRLRGLQPPRSSRLALVA